MSVPSFASFPKREPAKVSQPAGSASRLMNPTSGHDESVIAGPSFSSFPSTKVGTRLQDREASEKKSRDADETYSREDGSRHRRREGSRSRTQSTRDSASKQERDRVDRRKRSRSDDRERDSERSSRLHRKDKHRLSAGREHQDGRSRKADPDKRRDKEDRHIDISRVQANPPARLDPADKLDLDPKEFYTDTRGDQDILRFGPQRGMRYIPSGRESALLNLVQL